MKFRSPRSMGVFALLVLIAGLFTGGASAGEQGTLDVTGGAFLEQAFARARANAVTHEFFPKRLTLHEGTQVHFDILPLGGALILPANVGAQDWIDDNAATPDDPFSFVVLDPDEAPGNLKGNNAVVFPTDPACGGPATPCSVDGTAVVGSGVLAEGDSLTFDVTVDLDAGDFVWVVNPVFPAHRMKITVVPETDETTSQAQINAERRGALSLYADSAAALHSKLSSRRTSHRVGKNKRVWDAFAGYDTRHFSLFHMYPRRMKIRRGDRVRWHFDSLNDEIHTATLPTHKALPIANRVFAPVCDPDGDASPGPDTPPEVNGPPFCNDPSQLEFDVPAGFVLGRGNGKFAGNRDLESSGARGGGLSERSFTVRFTRRSKKGFSYACILHPFMRGRVSVR